MRAPLPFSRMPNRFAIPLALCAGVIALAGCPRMPRISGIDPSPGSTPSVRPSPLPSPSPSPLPSPSPSPQDDPVVRSLAVGAAPQDIAIDGSGTGYVALSTNIVKLVGATGTLTGVSSSSLAAQGVTVGSPAGLVMLGNTTWFTDRQGNRIRKINAPSSGPFGTLQDFAFGQAPGPIEQDVTGNLWVGDVGGRTIGAVKAGALTTADIFTGTLASAPVELDIDSAGVVWVLGENGQLSKVIPTLTGATLTGLTVQPVPVATLNRGKGLALSGNGALWITGVTPEGLNRLMRIDRGSGTSVENFPLPFVPGRFAIRGEFAWIPEVKPSGTDPTQTNVYKVSLLDGKVMTKTYPLGGEASNVFKDANTDIWFTIGSRNTVVKLDF